MTCANPIAESSGPPEGPPLSDADKIAVIDDPNWSLGVGVELFNTLGGLSGLGELGGLGGLGGLATGLSTYAVSAERRLAPSWWVRANLAGFYRTQSDGARSYRIDTALGARWLVLREGPFEFSTLGDVFVARFEFRAPRGEFAGNSTEAASTSYGFRGGLAAEWVLHRFARLRLSTALMQLTRSTSTGGTADNPTEFIDGSSFSARFVVAPTIEFRYAF